LTTRFDQLPPTLQKTLKVLSCLGCQVEESTIEALDSRNEILSFSIKEELPVAIEEGILEKAGPLYQFTHDILHSTIYEQIPTQSRVSLHRLIGKALLKTSMDNSSIHTLAADQINIFCKISIPSVDECPLFAESNAKAAKIAIAAYSFQQGEYLTAILPIICRSKFVFMLHLTTH